MTEPSRRGGRRATDPILDLAAHDAPFVTLGVAARLFGVRRATLLKWHDAGLLALVRLGGGCVRVETAELRRFVQQARVQKKVVPAVPAFPTALPATSSSRFR